MHIPYLGRVKGEMACARTTDVLFKDVGQAYI